MADLIESLRAVREGYHAEAALHRLYLDAYSGSGGFSGAVTQPTSGFWGLAAEIYSALGQQDAEGINRHTYLDRFQREDLDKFRRRVQAAHYSNYIKPLTDLKLSYVLRKDFAVENRPDAISEWRANTDGKGKPWAQRRGTVALRSATLGWCPVLIDMPPAPRNRDGSRALMTRAIADELGIRPRAIPLFPANLADYQTDDDGLFTWCKIRTDHTEQQSPFTQKYTVTRYTVWYPDRFSVYELVDSAGQAQPFVRTITEDESHDFGRVPIAVLRHGEAPDDPIKGVPMHGQETQEARAHFNRMSELEEHLRSQVFAILVLAMDENEEAGEIQIGTDNGLYLDPAAAQKHYYMSPDAGVASTYESRLEKTVEEIYRQARVEFVRPTQSRTAVSGIARKFEFAQTDRALADFAKQIAIFEKEIDRLVGAGLGISKDELDEIAITPPTSFDVEDLQTDLDLALSAIRDLEVGPTATRLMRSRIIKSILPNLSEDDAAAIDDELVELEAQDAADEAAEAELGDAAAEAQEEPEEPQQPQQQGQPQPGA